MSLGIGTQDGAAQLATEAPTHDLGQTLGVYRLIDTLGEGGMGRVFLAEHALLGRRVALKVLRSEFASDPFVVKRFFAEARTVNQISHDNIVEITDFVDGEDGTSFIVMEYLQGRALSDVIRGGPIGIRRAVHIALQIASALGAVHAVGIVHRDLKPDNVFLIERPHEPDFVKLLDFGAAKLNPKVVPGSVQTQAVTLIGTPQYMSPEQATGAPIDHRSDVYALGVVLYELVTGGNPFHAADTWSVIRRQVSLEPEAPETVVSMVPPCPNLNDLIMRCLDKEPAKRPESMAEIEGVLAAIERDLSTVPGGAPRAPARAPSDAAPPSTLMLRAAGVGPRRGPPKLLVAAAVVVGGLVAATLAFDRSEEVAAEPVREVAAAAATPSVPAPVDRQVLLRSEPPGAEVRLEGAEEVLGKTPLTVRVPARAAHPSYTFTLPGHLPRTLALEVDSGAAPVVRLEPRPAVKPAPAPRARPRAHRPAVRRARPTPEPTPRAEPAPVPASRAAPKPVGKNGVIDPFME